MAAAGFAPVRWGILGCAGIAEKLCVAFAEADNAVVHCVGSRSKKKAEAWVAKNCAGAHARGSYEEVLNDPDVQAVYIPLPTGVRTEWVLKAAAAGKHVLSEKPIAGDEAQTRKIFAELRPSGVQYMDDTMFMHNPRTFAVQTMMADTALFGTPYQVTSAFSLPYARTNEDFSGGNIRIKKETEPLGALGDVGWYCVRFSLFAFNYDAPTAVSCTFIEQTDEGVPLHAIGSMHFSGNRLATFDCSFKHAWRQWAEVCSERCSLRIDDFVIPNRIDQCSFTVDEVSLGDRALTLPRQEVARKDFGGKPQHTLLVERFSSIVSSGQIEDSWPKMSELTNLLLTSMVSSAQQGGAWVAPALP